jgi:hypothetical protein
VAQPPSPRTWVTGEVVSKALLDQEIRDAINAILDRPRAVMFNTTNQSIPNETHTAVAFDGEFDDSDGAHDTATNNTRFTAPYTGEYLCVAAIPFTQNAVAHKVELNFRRNGTDWFTGTAQMKTSANITLIANATSLVYLAAGDYVEAVVWHNYGSALAIDAAYKAGPNFSAFLINA